MVGIGSASHRRCSSSRGLGPQPGTSIDRLHPPGEHPLAEGAGELVDQQLPRHAPARAAPEQRPRGHAPQRPRREQLVAPAAGQHRPAARDAGVVADVVGARGPVDAEAPDRVGWRSAPACRTRVVTSSRTHSLEPEVPDRLLLPVLLPRAGGVGEARGQRDRLRQPVPAGDVGRRREDHRRVAPAREEHVAGRLGQRIERGPPRAPSRGCSCTSGGAGGGVSPRQRPERDAAVDLEGSSCCSGRARRELSRHRRLDLDQPAVAQVVAERREVALDPVRRLVVLGDQRAGWPARGPGRRGSPRRSGRPPGPGRGTRRCGCSAARSRSRSRVRPRSRGPRRGSVACSSIQNRSSERRQPTAHEGGRSARTGEPDDPRTRPRRGPRSRRRRARRSRRASRCRGPRACA